MPLHRVGSLPDIGPGQTLEAVLGDTRLAVCNVDGQLHAVEGVCPHRGGPLAHGALHGRMLVCPWHAWEFDCITGAYDANPSVRLRRYRVEVRGEDIYVELP